MSDLYQEVIIDHAHAPRNQGVCSCETHQQKGVNPLCGDQLQVSLQIEDDRIKDIKFTGEGCAISMASASLMTEVVQAQTLSETARLFEQVHAMLTKKSDANTAPAALGKLAVLQGVSAYPMRVKCATLAWHTLMAAIAGEQEMVSTEEGVKETT